MSQFPIMQSVRQLVEKEFRGMGASEGCIRETIMVRDGLYCGRRLRSAGYQAVWFAEEREVKFFRPDGELSHVVKIDDESQRDQAA